MIKIFFSKIKNSFLTPKYKQLDFDKLSKNGGIIFKILSKFIWFIPNNNQYKYWLNAEDVDHGYKKFIQMDELSEKILETIIKCSNKDDKILDICCNVGRVLNALSVRGYKNLYGFDINATAIEESKKVFPLLNNANLKADYAENYLNSVKNKEFDITFSLGASLELIPSQFSLIYHISRITKKYHICLINENGHAYPRFWKFEFKKYFSFVEYSSYGKDRTLFILKNEK